MIIVIILLCMILTLLVQNKNINEGGKSTIINRDKTDNNSKSDLNIADFGEISESNTIIRGRREI